MESRARLAMGGAAVFAASVAVVASVAVTNAAALADAPGVSIDAAALSVPSSARSTAPSIDREPSAAPSASAAVGAAVTVPAPAPVAVAAPSAPAVEAPSDAVQAEVIAKAGESGSWDAAYAWAADHGWTQAQVDRWINRLKVELDKLEVESAWQGEKSSPRSQTPVPTGNPSAPAATTPGDGSKKDRSDGTPDRRDR